jgi:hypothetical protein
MITISKTGAIPKTKNKIIRDPFSFLSPLLVYVVGEKDVLNLTHVYNLP